MPGTTPGGEADRVAEPRGAWHPNRVAPGTGTRCSSTTTASSATGSHAAAGFVEAGYAVLWDGVVGPWFLGRIARRLARREVVLRYLVLCASRDVAIERVRRRDGSPETSGVAAIWDAFADLGDLEHHRVSGDGDTDTVIGRCRLALEGGALTVPLAR